MRARRIQLHTRIRGLAMGPLTARWRKSTRSAQGNCVEVSYSNEMILVRDTKAQGEGPTLSFTRGEWSAFVAGVRQGEFELPQR
ncbi:DUF397 domain-containing protein [Actinoplanes sp. NPDC024001]|uniref:DUF397 domain-containing protein n=1 Tax=Actinoplanes sp. NPDC024001 TaxID=3154598 RepID=UPI0033CA2114